MSVHQCDSGGVEVDNPGDLVRSSIACDRSLDTSVCQWTSDEPFNEAGTNNLEGSMMKQSEVVVALVRKSYHCEAEQ